VSQADSHADHGGGPTRREFLYVATGAAGAVGVGAAVWPLIDQMNPSKDVLALATVEIDLSGVAEGSQLTIKWRGKPVFVRHRTAKEVEEARAVAVSDLKDQSAENQNNPGAPAADENRAYGENGEWLVMIGVCTHLGCIPLGDGAGEYEGWFCPCHGSHYDTSGRIRKGPAPKNLEIPKLEFVSDTLVKVG